MNHSVTFLRPVSTAAGPASAVEQPAWYCLRVPARREQIAALNLRQRTRVGVFAPQINIRRETTRGRTRAAAEALFPGYVFARFNYPAEARHVASTPGVLALVQFGGPPRAIADSVIAHLDHEVQAAAANSAEPAFGEGAWVRLVAGCFRGSEGRVLLDAGAATSRVCVLLSLLGQEVQISVPREQLTDMGAAAGRHFPAGLRASAAPASNSTSRR